MRPPDPPPPVTDRAYLDELVGLVRPFGVTHTGVTSAAVLDRARVALHDRLSRGLDDGMQFTFKNPERSTDPARAVRDARSIFVAARSYLLDPDSCPDAAGEDRSATPLGRIARYAWVDHLAPLRDALHVVTRRLRADGFAAVPFADDNSIVDRDVAHRAGLGWFGKNANLLLPGAGSWFVLGCVVTSASLPVADAPVDDGCGVCRRCLDACPTGAIVEPGVIDAARCLAWVLQKPGIVPRHLRPAIGDRLYGCDDCQDSCPPTVRFGAHHGLPVRGDRPVDAAMSLLELLRAADDALVARWGHRYLADRDPRWVRRNALVVLGNIGDPASAAVREVLADYRAHHDPVLRVHAVWAIRQLGLTGLLPDSDPDPDVVAELQAL